MQSVSFSGSLLAHKFFWCCLIPTIDFLGICDIYLWHLSVTFLINSNFNLTLTQSIWEMRCLSEKNSKRSQQTHCSKQTNKQGSWTQLFTIFSILIHHVFFFLQLWITFCSATQPIPKKLIKLWMTFAQRSQSRKSLGRATASPPHVVPGPPLPRRGEIWRWITLTFLTTWPAGWIVGRVRFLQINFSRLALRLWRSAWKTPDHRQKVH